MHARTSAAAPRQVLGKDASIFPEPLSVSVASSRIHAGEWGSRCYDGSAPLPEMLTPRRTDSNDFSCGRAGACGCCQPVATLVRTSLACPK